MNRNTIFLIGVILAMSLLTACGGSTQGPTTWFDQPLNGSQFPLMAIILQAHASDEDGVARIQFLHGEELLGEVSTGSQRLGDAIMQWTPTKAGSYTLLARAEDSQGNFGPATTVQIVVGAVEVGTATPTPAPATAQCASEALVAPVLLSPGDGESVIPDPVLAWSYPDANCHPYSYQIDISEDASFSDISLGFGTLSYTETSRAWPLPAGQCYFWRAMAYVPDVNGPASTAWQFCVAGEGGPTFTLDKNANCREGPGTAYDVDDTLLQGQMVTIEGRNAESSWLWVQKPSSSGHCWVSAITGQISGDLTYVQVVAAPGVTEVPTQEPIVILDTTPPAISDIYADPDSIQTAGCGEPSTTLVGASVSDEGGISRVTARVSGFGEVDMSDTGGGDFEAVLGPFDYTGELSIIIQAWDNAGNVATAGPLTISVMCIG